MTVPSTGNTLEVAKLTLLGVRDNRICSNLGISQAELGTLKKSRRYRKTAQKLAKSLLEAAEIELQAAASQAVQSLVKTLKVKPSNRSGQAGSGLERRVADPALLREKRLAAEAIIKLAREIGAEETENEQLAPLLKELAGA